MAKYESAGPQVESSRRNTSRTSRNFCGDTSPRVIFPKSGWARLRSGDKPKVETRNRCLFATAENEERVIVINELKTACAQVPIVPLSIDFLEQAAIVGNG